MTLELTHGKPIPLPKRPCEIYRLTLDFMFGDGDGSEQVEVDFKSPLSAKNEARLSDFVRLMQAYDQLSHNTQCEYSQDSDLWHELAESIGVAKSNAENFVDHIPGDPMSDYQYQGSLQDWNITYFDQGGVEYEVEVKT